MSVVSVSVLGVPVDPGRWTDHPRPSCFRQVLPAGVWSEL